MQNSTAKIAIAVLHGMGEPNTHQTVELKHRVTERYLALDKHFREDDLVWHTVEWGESLLPKQQALKKAVNYRNDLDYPGLRELFCRFFGAALSYRSESDWNIKEQIDSRLREHFGRLASHRRVQPGHTPMVILSHSFSSVLLAEYINEMHHRQREQGDVAGLTPMEQFDTLAGLITFGSPLAVYSVFTGHLSQALNISGRALPQRSRDAVKWLNFYDKDDVIAYPLKGINEAWNQAVSEEYEINVGSAATSWNPACHNEYWDDGDFFKPVAKYLAGLRKTLE